jgi:hypothetical protein
MKIFTNKYFTQQSFSIIYKNLVRSPQIMQINNTVYIPILINDINIKNNKFYASTHNSSFLPNRIDEYVAKFYYINDKEFDLIDIKDHLKLNIKIDTNYKKKIIVSNDIKIGDIILVEDSDKFGGVI